MPTFIYTEKENGDLKLQAEIEEDMDDGEAVDLLIENSPRLKSQERFVVLVGSLEDGVMSVVEEVEEVITRTSWKSSRNGDAAEAPAPARRGRAAAAAEEDDDDEAEAPAPPKRRRPAAAKKGTATKARPRASTAAKKATTTRSRTSGRKSAGRSTAKKAGGGSPFKRNPASDE